MQAHLAPIRRALGDDWDHLAEVIRQHYDLSSNQPRTLIVKGQMNVEMSLIGKGLIAIGRIFGALVPYTGNNVPVQVRNWSEPDNRDMHWHRTFNFPGRSPTTFCSRMAFDDQDRIIEYVKFGLGIKMRLNREGDVLRYDSCGYCWNLGAVTLKLPDWLLLGTAIIREHPIDQERFQVEFEINHPLWGKTFGYTGQFQLCEETLANQ